tara:strand:+ start:153 stop:371 length:219 start_codon:yes stop_codon:yes gene_type:complete
MFSCVLHSTVVGILKTQTIGIAVVWHKSTYRTWNHLLTIVENPNIVIIPLPNDEKKKTNCKEINFLEHNSTQ